MTTGNEQPAGAPQDESGDSHPPVPDLRAARVLEAHDHPNADRLLVLKIDLGQEQRQIVGGIVGHYEPEELEGKPIVVVANLQHAKLRGEVSQGMLLAAEALFRSGKRINRESIREALSGNICRCTGMNLIVEAIYSVAQEGDQS